MCSQEEPSGAKWILAIWAWILSSPSNLAVLLLVSWYIWICGLDYSISKSKVRFQDLSGLSPLVKIALSHTRKVDREPCLLDVRLCKVMNLLMNALITFNESETGYIMLHCHIDTWWICYHLLNQSLWYSKQKIMKKEDPFSQPNWLTFLHPPSWPGVIISRTSLGNMFHFLLLLTQIPLTL